MHPNSRVLTHGARRPSVHTSPSHWLPPRPSAPTEGPAMPPHAASWPPTPSANRRMRLLMLTIPLVRTLRLPPLIPLWQKLPPLSDSSLRERCVIQRTTACAHAQRSRAAEPTRMTLKLSLLTHARNGGVCPLGHRDCAMFSESHLDCRGPQLHFPSPAL